MSGRLAVPAAASRARAAAWLARTLHRRLRTAALSCTLWTWRRPATRASADRHRARRRRRAPPDSRRRRGARLPSRDRSSARARCGSRPPRQPSATMTMPACSELPMPTPPPWWNETQVAPLTRVEQRVQDRPVGDRVGAVPHRLGLAVGRGDRAAVEVVAPDDDRRGDLAGGHQLVEEPARPDRARRSRASRCGPAVPGTPPAAAPCGSSASSLRSSGNSSRIASSVTREVRRIAGQDRPAERPLALAEERPDEHRHEPADVEGVATPASRRLAAQVVAVVEGHRAARAEARASRARAPPSKPSRARRTRRGIVARSARAAA